jgi:hypothetical protein
MGYIYQTTNLINNKKYIGKTNGNKGRAYLGSGILLLKAIKKYGKDNFKNEIIYTTDSEEELRKMEKYYIELENAVENPTYYNLHEGGQGGHIPKKKGSMSAVTKKYWDSLSEEEYKERCKYQGNYNKTGSNNPKSKAAIVNGKEYACLKDALQDFDIPYSSLKYAARTQIFNTKYKISAQYK